MNENSPIYKTRFYSDCIGVFQGGSYRRLRSAALMMLHSNLGFAFQKSQEHLRVQSLPPFWQQVRNRHSFSPNFRR